MICCTAFIVLPIPSRIGPITLRRALLTDVITLLSDPSPLLTRLISVVRKPICALAGGGTRSTTNSSSAITRTLFARRRFQMVVSVGILVPFTYSFPSSCSATRG